MRKLTQNELLAVTGATQRQVENWLGRLPLVTQYEPTVQGRARGFSKDNVMEIGLIDRLVKGGMKPAAAAECAAELFKAIRGRKPHGWVTVFIGGNLPIDYLVSDKPPKPEFFRSVKGAFVLNVAQLEAEIDEFMEDLQ
jgi:hypothetical protein